MAGDEVMIITRMAPIATSASTAMSFTPMAVRFFTIDVTNRPTIMATPNRLRTNPALRDRGRVVLAAEQFRHVRLAPRLHARPRARCSRRAPAAAMSTARLAEHLERHRELVAGRDARERGAERRRNRAEARGRRGRSVGTGPACQLTSENRSGVTTSPRPKNALPKLLARAGSFPSNSTTGISVLPTVFRHIAPTPSRMQATMASPHARGRPEQDHARRRPRGSRRWPAACSRTCRPAAR